jgi:hypothetical protein
MACTTRAVIKIHGILVDFLLFKFNVVLMKIKRRQERSAHQFLPSQLVVALFSR